ncbi:TonB-dependent receptor [bacterium]|nr:TonB-dependent receptor [bacterium]
MNKSGRFSFCLDLLMLILLLSGLVFGQSGKIRGIVTEAKAGHILMGANVFIRGTRLGTATNENGEYVILNVPPGRYDVVATFMGYQQVTVENIIVTHHLSTYCDIEMPRMILEAQEVVVVAERPLIDQNATNDIKVIRTENLEHLPIRGFGNIIAAQGGAVEDQGYLHVRGGRHDEVAFYLDGVLMNNPYTRIRTGAVSDMALEEIAFQPGGMDAEYGGFNSGIVSMTTKTGGNRYTVSGEVVTDAFLDDHQARWGLDTYSYGYHLYNASFSGPVPKTGGMLKFFVNAEYLDQKDRSPRWGPSVKPVSFHENIDSLIRICPEPTPLYGVKPNNRTRNLTGTANLKYRFKNIQFKAGGHYFSRDYRDYIHARAPFNAAHMPKGMEDIYTGYIEAVVMIADNAFLEMNANYYQRDWEYGDPVIWDDFENWTNPELIPNIQQTDAWGILPAAKREFVYFETFGYPQTWFYRENMHRSHYKLDGTWQIHQTHELRTGAEIFTNMIRFYEIGAQVSGAVRQAYLDAATEYREPTRQEISEAYKSGYANPAGWDIFGRHRINSGENAPRQPKTVSFYIKDKMEFDDMVLNLGVRIDHITVDQKGIADPYHITLDTLGMIAGENFTRAPVYNEINPRLGIAFPVTDRTVFHLQYGKYTQPAPYQLTYISWEDFETALTSGNFTDNANPNLKPVKTTSYEVGFEQQIGENASLGMTAYYKEVRDQIFLNNRIGASPRSYTMYDNGDFGNVKGFSFDFSLRRTHRVMADINYTIQWANGTGSDPATQYHIAWHNPEERPTYVAPLDYDQRHTATINIDFRTLAKDGPKLWGGYPLGRLGVNLWYTYGSGLAYTPEQPVSMIFGGTASRIPEGAINSAHWAPASSLNIRVDKEIQVGHFSFNPFLWIINLFNSRKFARVYPATGLPSNDGWFSTNEGQHWAEDNPEAAQWYDFRLADPENYGEPRQIRLGLRVEY